MPQESAASEEIAITRHRLLLIQSDGECVDCLLVDVSAPLMVINEGHSRRKVNFSALLDPSQLTDRLGHWTFLEDAEGFPEY